MLDVFTVLVLVPAGWCILLTIWDARDFRRYVFARGDHIKYYDGTQERMGRVDQIFIRKLPPKTAPRRMFIVVKPIEVMEDIDEVLGLHASTGYHVVVSNRDLILSFLPYLK